MESIQSPITIEKLHKNSNINKSLKQKPDVNFQPYQRVSCTLPTPYEMIDKVFNNLKTCGNSRELMALNRMYCEENKYGDSLTIAFSKMLKAMVLEYYYSSCQGINLTIKELDKRFQDHFEGGENRRNMLREWNAINLRAIFRENPEKEKGPMFNEMVQRLRAIIAACRDVPACGPAIVHPTSSIAALCNTIYEAIENNEAAIQAEKLNEMSSTYFTDRKYHESSHSTKINPCFFCKKLGCWSDKHSLKERANARTKFSNTITAYIQEYDAHGSETDDNKDLSGNIEALTLDINNDDINVDEWVPEPEYFDTTTSKVHSNDAKSFYHTLANHSVYHSLSQNIKTPENFVIFGRYNSNRFLGIMLDTRAANKSTAGYDQAQA
ncbi:putative glycosyl transferase [Golovinomyces cichoracearum]|uniref:Putative glycosyl transferase n=1 Tax=Golovinomyces cichoracearum TaxID=62708 RepID=A0A420JAS8_9PEZI|nr:putative glycosyl transferase [Golovinomyces cichoracearum]